MCSIQHHVFVCINLYLLDCIEGSVPGGFASPLKPQFYYTYLACPLGACTPYI